VNPHHGSADSGTTTLEVQENQLWQLSPSLGHGRVSEVEATAPLPSSSHHRFPRTRRRFRSAETTGGYILLRRQSKGTTQNLEG